MKVEYRFNIAPRLRAPLYEEAHLKALSHLLSLLRNTSIDLKEVVCSSKPVLAKVLDASIHMQVPLNGVTYNVVRLSVHEDISKKIVLR